MNIKEREKRRLATSDKKDRLGGLAYHFVFEKRSAKDKPFCRAKRTETIGLRVLKETIASTSFIVRRGDGIDNAKMQADAKKLTKR